MSKKKNPQVTEYIEKSEEYQKTIMSIVRALVHENVPEVIEEFKWSRPVFTATKSFAYLKTAKNHVTLGFYKFERLNDAKNLFEGTGKDMRHIKLKSGDDIDPKLLAEWLKKASE